MAYSHFAATLKEFKDKKVKLYSHRFHISFPKSFPKLSLAFPPLPVTRAAAEGCRVLRGGRAGEDEKAEID